MVIPRANLLITIRTIQHYIFTDACMRDLYGKLRKDIYTISYGSIMGKAKETPTLRTEVHKGIH